MSILIKGMEMPIGCAFCKIKRRNGKKMVCPFCDEEWDIHDPMSADFRLDRCPLVPVPPHGRLGDLDALRKRIEENIAAAKKAGNYEWWYACTVALDFALAAPTIIPAEPAEEEMK